MRFFMIKCRGKTDLVTTTTLKRIQIHREKTLKNPIRQIHWSICFFLFISLFSFQCKSLKCVRKILFINFN